jgi:hypothetical protein
MISDMAHRSVMIAMTDTSDDTASHSKKAALSVGLFARSSPTVPRLTVGPGIKIDRTGIANRARMLKGTPVQA